MKNLVSRISLMLLLLGLSLGSTAVAQYNGQRPTRHHYHSRTSDVLRGLDAVETAAEYAMLGTRLAHIDDYTGLRFGFNSASMRLSGFDAGSESITGVDLGIVFGWYLGKSKLVSVEPGLYYSMKGGRIYSRSSSPSFGDWGGTRSSSSDYNIKMTMHSFELPVVFKLHLPVVPMVSLQPFAGAFMSFGFAGTTTFDSHSSSSEKYDSFDDGILEDFDAGLRTGIALNIRPVYMEIAYDYGLLNLDANFYDASLRSNTWSFNVGINF